MRNGNVASSNLETVNGNPLRLTGEQISTPRFIYSRAAVVPALSDSNCWLRKHPVLRFGVFLWRQQMEDKAFPAHVVGFMNRKREKERQQQEEKSAERR